MDQRRACGIPGLLNLHTQIRNICHRCAGRIGNLCATAIAIRSFSRRKACRQESSWCWHPSAWSLRTGSRYSYTLHCRNRYKAPGSPRSTIPEKKTAGRYRPWPRPRDASFGCMMVSLRLKARFHAGRHRRRILQVPLESAKPHTGFRSESAKKRGAARRDNDNRILPQNVQDISEDQLQAASRTGAHPMRNKPLRLLNDIKHVLTPALYSWDAPSDRSKPVLHIPVRPFVPCPRKYAGWCPC